MNQYGHLAERYWMDYLPNRVEAMTDPDRFFADLGIQVQTEVETIYTATTKVTPDNLGPAQIEGWKNMARTMAEERVLAELVYLEPDPGEDEDWLPEEPGWRDLWPDTIVTDVIQESYDAESGPLA